MTILMSILSVFGSGLSSIFNWAISYFQKWQANKQAASDQMNKDITDHAGDGAKSVNDSDSVDWQLGNIDDKLKQMDGEAPVKPEGDTHA